ncbi:2-(1,2-epoxy-1,2-dihydrophenyl)acetyl-CoA isomerase PaaG [uncultured Thiothrix sp.]|uniref:2-(1,2-epoxy-1,2-dihydrophenyl)acetyl-CoA isomerase PaaG n=1 Tax=uncultured Thiothrix sp. TaxID=223185 RepID=UPI0026355BE5|nr:2-(1,2-epoxy-1,2-dihydrophenyl)acetyl-CoA isomerase PaaG [uncultured Thiothrix sp.]HMT92479.1 2-(1,2-epoxy-1,2-dihydrophenyl)acetyl-CoA isomerase PaaG [Thiolinea sp.]
MNFQTIDLAIAEGVATLTFNRPDKLNSFTTAMHAELREALSAIQADTNVRCLLITGKGRGFCAGQDLADEVASADIGATVERDYNPLVRSLTTLPIPVICAVNGIAAGAGANIALACDIVLAARSASFIQAFCKIGLVPDSGGTWTLPRVVGHARAMALTLLGEKISAEKAETWGMIWKCVDDADLMAEALKLAKHLAIQPTKGLAMTKQAIHAAGTHTLDQQLDLERDLQAAAAASDDFKEGVNAFLEKRAPVFKGA